MNDALQSGWSHHQAGRLAEAALAYQHLIASDPNNADAWQLLGACQCQRGNLSEAVECLKRAILLRPDSLEAHFNLGLAWQQMQRHENAIAAYQQALNLAPADADTHLNLGNAHWSLADYAEAERCYRRVLSINPSDAEALSNLGNALARQRQLAEAETCYRQALAMQPAFASTLYNLGNLLLDQSRLDEAAVSFERAVKNQPGLADAHKNLGVVYRRQGKLAAAVACYRQALALRENDVETATNLAHLLQESGQPDEAEQLYRAVLADHPGDTDAKLGLAKLLLQDARLDEAEPLLLRAIEEAPHSAEAHNSLGHLCLEERRLPEAEHCFARAIQLDPAFAEPHWNQALLWLLEGDFARGWPKYEWRWQTDQLPLRHADHPRWQGEPLAGKTILVHAEQGFGDTLQFVRYCTLLQSRGGRVLFECSANLHPLLQRTPGIDHLVATGASLPPFDCQIPLLSLPAVFATSLATIPASVPYVFADPALIATWRQRISPGPSLRVGLHWRGREGRGLHRRRDIPLECVRELASLRGIRLFSLQRGAGRAELLASEAANEIFDFGDDIDAAHGAFMDTAAIICNLDLVITSDTSIAHLAGALGIPVWVALPFAGDWRWLQGRDDSPWYPTMRLFRQPCAGDWPGVLAAIQEALSGIPAG